MPTPDPIQPIQPVYLTTEQAAAITQLATGTLENWRYRRQGPPWIKVGGVVRYEESAFHTWLAAQTVTEIPQEAS